MKTNCDLSNRQISNEPITGKAERENISFELNLIEVKGANEGTLRTLKYTNMKLYKFRYNARSYISNVVATFAGNCISSCEAKYSFPVMRHVQFRKKFSPWFQTSPWRITFRTICCEGQNPTHYSVYYCDAWEQPTTRLYCLLLFSITLAHVDEF